MSAPLATATTNTRAGSTHPVTVATRYTKSYDTTGWLKIRLEMDAGAGKTGDFVFVSEYVQVSMAGDKGGRTFFVLREGPYAGRTASLGTENAPKCLVVGPRGTGAKLVAKVESRQWLVSKPRRNERLNQLVATLTFNGITAMITLDSDVAFVESDPSSPDNGKTVRSQPLPKGTYKIFAPTEAHKPGATAFYVTREGGNPDLKYHTVWFPIEYAKTRNSNFVHVGNLSEGCVTMYDLTKWNALYAYLISNRLDSKGIYVGTVTIE